MNDSDNICPRCGARMKQTGADNQRVRYHCSSCGHDMSVMMNADDNTVYWQMRSDLMMRVANGVSNWETTQWDYLRKDIIDFMARYQEARNDICFKMAIVACITKGFHDMNSEKYKECKTIFKFTEKIYKKFRKGEGIHLKDEDVTNYEEYRTMYKKVRNEYRNTKLAWKAVTIVAKNVIRF